MLKGIFNNNVQNNQVAQTTGTDKTGLFAPKNPYEKIDKNLLVDQLDISNDALKMYQKDIDIKNFTKITLSNPDDTSHNNIVASKIENGIIEFNEDDIIDSLFKNKNFLKDLAG